MKISVVQPEQQVDTTAVAATQEETFPPINKETRTHVNTACAAFHLTRKDQTLRTWACLENGPLRPVRVNGRLAWAVADIKRLLNGGQ
jgi:hypothetical protein